MRAWRTVFKLDCVLISSASRAYSVSVFCLKGTVSCLRAPKSPLDIPFKLIILQDFVLYRGRCHTQMKQKNNRKGTHRPFNALGLLHSCFFSEIVRHRLQNLPETSESLTGTSYSLSETSGGLWGPA